MGRKSRDKGATGERELARELSALLGVEARRGCQYHGGPESPDVVADIPDVHIECKRTERLRLYEAIEQAIADAGAKVPVVAHRQNHQPWVVIARLEDLPRLATQIYLTLAENA
jgi:Holliday junction resolvase